MSVVMEIRGAREVEQMLGALSPRDAGNRIRRAMRAALRPIRKELRTRARAGRYPKAFRRTRTRAHRNPLGVSISPASPLSAVFEEGAKPHPIGSTGGLLSNFESRRQAGDLSRFAPFVARGPITHPGMAARPISGPAFDAARAEAERLFSEELLRDL